MKIRSVLPIILSLSALALVGCNEASHADAAPAASAVAEPATSTQATSQPAPPAANTVGSTVTFQGTDAGGSFVAGAVTLNGVRRLYHSETGFHGDVPDVNTSWLVIDVTISTRLGSLPYHPLDWSVTTPNGLVETYDIYPLNAYLQYGAVDTGHEVTGEIAFDVPEGALYVNYSIGGRIITTFQVAA